MKQPNAYRPFKVPDTYFSGLEQEVMDQLAFEAQAQTHKDQESFQVPNDYFDRIDPQQFISLNQNTTVQHLRPYLIKTLAIAASLTLIWLLTTKKDLEPLAQISDEQIEQYAAIYMDNDDFWPLISAADLTPDLILETDEAPNALEYFFELNELYLILDLWNIWDDYSSLP